MGDDGWVAGTDAVGSMCTHMVSQVVGNDSWGGWTQPGPTPSNLSSCSLLQWREREREPGICIFFHTIHLSVSSKTMMFHGGLNFFWGSPDLIIVFITSMNIVHSLSKHSHVQSESAHEIKLYLSHKLAVVGTQFFSPYISIAQVTSMKYGIFTINAKQ